MKLKIKRNEYEITSDDIFMDNNACIQLLSQSKELSNHGRKPNPVLSKRAEKEIKKFERVQLTHRYGSNVEVFKLKIEE